MDEGMLDGVVCMIKFVNFVVLELEIFKVNEIGKYIVKFFYFELDRIFLKFWDIWVFEISGLK